MPGPVAVEPVSAVAEPAVVDALAALVEQVGAAAHVHAAVAVQVDVDAGALVVDADDAPSAAGAARGDCIAGTDNNTTGYTGL